MRCQDCGGAGAHHRTIKVAGACCPPCWRKRERDLRRMKVRDRQGHQTDENHRASRKLFAVDPEPAELSVDGWYGGAA